MITIHGTKQKEETYGLIAKTWQEVDVGVEIEIVQPNDLGGKSLEKVILSQFPNAQSESKKKSRFIKIVKTNNTPLIISEWLEHTKLRFVDAIGFHSMPGLFGWNKIDVGSKLLAPYLENLRGIGADFGCGYGYLTHHILEQNSKIKMLYAMDFDERAIEACTKNITDTRAIIQQTDCSKKTDNLSPLDFVVMNPPFHEYAREDRGLGQHFIETASQHLKKHGICWIVANKHLPYEATLSKHFHSHEKITEQNGFKIFKAVK